MSIKILYSLHLLRQLHQSRHKRQHRPRTPNNRQRLRRKQSIQKPTHGRRRNHLHRPNRTIGNTPKQSSKSHRGSEAGKEQKENCGEALGVETVGNVGGVVGETHGVVAADAFEEGFEEWGVFVVAFVDCGCGGGGAGHGEGGGVEAL